MKTAFLGRSLFLFVALLATAFTFNSCRKDLIVQSPDNLKNALSIAEAKSYFNTHFASSKKKSNNKAILSGKTTLAELLSVKEPIWEHAYQKVISTGQAVKIPIDFGSLLSVVGGKRKGLVPTSSLNYLLMYRGKDDSIRIEWVKLYPDSAWLYGKRTGYRGKIRISDWNGKLLRSYTYGEDGLKKPAKRGEAFSLAQSQVKYECYRVPNGRCPRLGVCATECDVCLSTCAFEVCFLVEDEEEEDDPPYNNPPYSPPGGGETGDPGGSGGGGDGGGPLGPGNYPPNCNPDPTYTVPNYPAPAGTEWILPCVGDEVPIPYDPYDGIDLSSAVRTLAIRLALTIDEAGFLELQYQNPGNTLLASLNSYLATNNYSQDSEDFAKWAVGYLLANQNVSGFDVNREAELLTFREGSDLGMPALDWDSYTPPQQKQPMPTFATISTNWPYTTEVGTGFLRSSAEYAYSLAGGQLAYKNIQGVVGYQNACAIRGSICLNNSGYPIPQISGTEKGANNKNFILRAVDFRHYLNTHFEGPKARLDINTGTTTDQIKNWLKADGGKTGIYIMVSKNATVAGYSGHVDLIINGLPINGYALNPKGGVDYIEIW